MYLPVLVWCLVCCCWEVSGVRNHACGNQPASPPVFRGLARAAQHRSTEQLPPTKIILRPPRPTVQRPPKARLQPLTDSPCLAPSRWCPRGGNHHRAAKYPIPLRIITCHFSTFLSEHTTTAAPPIVRCHLDRCPIDHAQHIVLPPRLPPPLHCRLYRSIRRSME